MALAVLDTVAAERAESHDDDDVRRRDRVNEKRSAMERKWVEGRGDMVRRVGRLEWECVWWWWCSAVCGRRPCDESWRIGGQ